MTNNEKLKNFLFFSKLNWQMRSDKLQNINCSEIIHLNCKDDLSSISDFYCGTDSVTYSNYCLFQKAKCRNSKLDLLYRGIFLIDLFNKIINLFLLKKIR